MSRRSGRIRSSRNNSTVLKGMAYKNIFLILLFYLNLVPVYAEDSLSSQAHSHYQKGQEYYQQGHYKEATEEFAKALDAAQQRKAADKAATRLVAKDVPQGGNVEYLIDIADVLDISVWKVPDLSRPEVIVRPDGKISLPLIGDIEAFGISLTRLDEVITQKYTLYVREPEVSVMVKRFGGSKVVVLGDVKTPGVYSFSGNIRLMEALALAGDCTKYAVRNNILVIRGDIHNNPALISCNVVSFLKYAKLSENVMIQPQDVVFVPRSAIGNLNSFFETIAPIIDGVYKTSTTDIYIKNARSVMEKTSNVKITQ